MLVPNVLLVGMGLPAVLRAPSVFRAPAVMDELRRAHVPATKVTGVHCVQRYVPEELNSHVLVMALAVKFMEIVRVTSTRPQGFGRGRCATPVTQTTCQRDAMCLVQ